MKEKTDGQPDGSELVRTIYGRCMSGRIDHAITATDVARHWQSPFGLYCRHFVNPSNKDPMDEAMEYYARLGRDHETATTSRLYPGVKAAKGESMSDAFLSAIREMEAGAQTILNGALMDRPNRMMGEPDVMIRDGGKSVFGDYHYRVQEIKSTANIRTHHILQTAFYNRLLGGIQNYTPGTFSILDGNGNERQYLYSEHSGLLDDTMAGVEAVLGGRKPTPTYGACPYPWSTYNDMEAVRTGDISLVGGLGVRRKEALAGRGITTLDGLIEAGSDGLTAVKGVSAKTARGYIVSARALKTGRPERRDGHTHTLRQEGVEAYIGFEGFDDGKHYTVFLIGAVVRSRDSEHYMPFLADRGGEGRIMRDFLAYMSQLKPAAVYHWHNFERTQLMRMVREHGIGDGESAPFTSGGMLQDLHRMAAGMYAFPVPGTSIKLLAPWMGFKRRRQDVSVPSPGMAYRRYVENGERGAAGMQNVIDNNHDYCAAMLVVKKWLEGNTA